MEPTSQPPRKSSISEQQPADETQQVNDEAHTATHKVTTVNNRETLKKSVQFDETTLDPHPHEGPITKKRTVTKYKTADSLVSQHRESFAQHAMLDHLRKGTPDALDAFVKEFNKSQCANSREQLIQLAENVRVCQHTLPPAAVEAFLETYMQAYVEQELNMVTNLSTMALAGKSREWMRNLELERLKTATLKDFSAKAIETAMQSCAQAISASYNLALPQDWKTLPEVSGEILIPSKNAEQEKKSREMAQALFPEAEAFIGKKLISLGKKTFEDWLNSDEVPENEKEEHKLETLDDYVLYFNNPVKDIVDSVSDYMQTFSSRQFKKARRDLVAKIISERLEEKYTLPDDDD